jgi:hypothetical protein
MSEAVEQFQELMTIAIVGTNRMLKRHRERTHLFVLGYILAGEDFDVSVGMCDSLEEFPEIVSSLHETLRRRVVELSSPACCMVIPEVDGSACVMWLEARDHECAELHIPMSGRPLQLDSEKLAVVRGRVRIFATHTA